MSGSHYAPDPWRYGLEDTIYEMTPVTSVTSPPQANGAPDLRTGPEREADELAALRLEVAALTDALNYANGRADALERRVKALEDAASRHADALTVIQLREGL